MEVVVSAEQLRTRRSGVRIPYRVPLKTAYFEKNKRFLVFIDRASYAAKNKCQQKESTDQEKPPDFYFRRFPF